MSARHPAKLLGATLSLAVLLCLSSPAWAKKKKKTKLQGSQVIGQVVDQTGERLSGVEVVIQLADGAEVDLQAISDEKGQFELELPKGGNYRFSLTKTGYGPYDTTLLVDAGTRQEMEFRLIEEQANARRDAALAFNAGVEAFKADDMATAKAKFLEARANNPTMPEALLGLADIYFHDGEHAAAAEAIEALLAARPDDPQGMRLAYRLALRQGDRAARAELIERLSALEATQGLAAETYNQGVVAVQENNVDLAIMLMRESSELDPSLAAPLETLATLLYNREQYDEALEVAERLVVQAPQSEPGFRIRYLVRDARQDESTSAAFDDYLAVAPEAAADMLYYRAELDFRSGALDDAKRGLLRLLEIRPEMANAHYTLGLSYSSAGETAGAKRHLQRFLELAPDHPEAASAREMLSYF